MTNIKNFFIVLLISLMCFFAVFVKRCDICQEYKKATFENQNIVFAAQIDSKWEYKNNESIFSISTPKHTIALSVDYWKTEADAIEFYKHPGMLCGAITLGNTIHYPGDKSTGFGPNYELPEGIKLGEHEGAHTIQGEILGPLYLPAHITTMGISIITTGHTHENNWLEKGPNSIPARPW